VSTTCRSCLALALVLGACRSRSPAEQEAGVARQSAIVDAEVAAEIDAGRPSLEELEVPGDLPAFVVRGQGPSTMVFLHGWCGSAMFYAHSFRRAAARRGTLVALQGNVPCDSAPDRDWSITPERLHERIEAALKAAGLAPERGNAVLIGYSSGALYAEHLAMRWPERYTRVVLIASPEKPAVYRLRHARAVVTIAPEIDVHELPKAGARELNAAGIPATFLVLPGASHGGMGTDPERAMDEALQFVGF
jgi:hypothetical protein